MIDPVLKCLCESIMDPALTLDDYVLDSDDDDDRCHTHGSRAKVAAQHSDANIANYLQACA